MSIANNPDLLIADEPTTALDVTIQLQILKLLKKLQKNLEMAILFISHDLAVVKNIADYICIMKDGIIVEQNTKSNIFNNPQHAYTKELIGNKNIDKEKKIISKKTILKIQDMKVWYPIKKGIFKRTIDYVKAVNSINIDLFYNQTLGIVGESGSGKTSLILALLKLISFKGKILFNNLDISKLKSKDLIKIRKDMQIIFQDPFSSLSPRMTVEEIVREGLDIHMKEVAINKNCGLLAYSPLAGGRLSGKYLDGARPSNARYTLWPRRFSRHHTIRGEKAIEKYVNLSKKYNIKPSTFATAFVNDRPFVTSNIIGATSINQLKENIDSIDIKLTSDILKEIEEIHLSDPNPCV